MMEHSPMTTEIDEDLIKKESGSYDLEVVKRLSLDNKGLSAIGNDLKGCLNLVELSLARNAIHCLRPGLQSFSKLVRLDLSSNRICHLGDALKGLNSLEYLDLKDNLVDDIQELQHLSRLPQLKSLFLKNYEGSLTNPICKIPEYQDTIIHLLPQLEVLDEESLRIKEMTQAKLQSFLDALLPDEEARKTPPVEAWYDDKEKRKMMEEWEREKDGDNKEKGRMEQLDDVIKQHVIEIQEGLKGIKELRQQVSDQIRQTIQQINELKQSEDE